MIQSQIPFVGQGGGGYGIIKGLIDNVRGPVRGASFIWGGQH